jgi:hypothetical protein
LTHLNKEKTEDNLEWKSGNETCLFVCLLRQANNADKWMVRLGAGKSSGTTTGENKILVAQPDNEKKS